MRFFSGVLGAALLLLPRAAPAIPPCKDCNVILISLDTVSVSHLGAYGSKRGNSPNIDRFAAAARLYRNAYAPVPWTLPSHAAMLTGFLPWHLGVQDEHDPLPTEVPTLAELLKTAGYRTGAFTSGYYVDETHGYHRGFDGFTQSPEWKDAAWIADQGIRWLRDNKEKKFFLFLHSYHAHEPFKPSEESLRALDPQHPGAFRETNYHELINLSLGRKTLDAGGQARLKTLYDAGIMDLDRELGRLFRFLDESGLNENTVILLTSDHGSGFGEHGLWGLHAYNVYEELVRVPLLVKAPQASAREIRSPVSLTDLVPSVLACVGAPGAGATDGRPLPEDDTPAAGARNIYAQTTLNKETALPALELAIETFKDKPDPARFTPRTTNQGRVMVTERMVRSGRYKLILKFDRSFELFDLDKDPSEKKNVLKKLPAVANRLKTLMLQELP